MPVPSSKQCHQPACNAGRIPSPSALPQEMANLLWSYATLGHYPGDQLLEAMALHMVDRIQAYRPQAVSNTLWAYAKVPPPSCRVVTGRQCAENSPKRTCTFKFLQHTPFKHAAAFALRASCWIAWVELLCTYLIVACANAWRQPDVCISLELQLRYNPGVQVLDAASRKAHQMLHQYTLQELSHTLWALAIFEHHPGAPLLPPV